MRFSNSIFALLLVLSFIGMRTMTADAAGKVLIDGRTFTLIGDRRMNSFRIVKRNGTWAMTRTRRGAHVQAVTNGGRCIRMNTGFRAPGKRSNLIITACDGGYVKVHAGSRKNNWRWR